MEFVAMQPPILLLGLGNDLRGDDAAGRLVAQEAAQWHLAGLRVIHVQQLVPELAAALADANTAILIDASRAGSNEPTLTPVTAEASEGSLTHHLSPGQFLGLARALFDWAGEMWLLSIPAESFEMGDAITARCRAGILSALSLLKTRLGG